MRKSGSVRIVLLIALLCLGSGCAYRSSSHGSNDYTGAGDLSFCPGNADDEIIVEVELVQMKKEILVHPKNPCIYKKAKAGWVSEVKWVLLDGQPDQILHIKGPAGVFASPKFQVSPRGETLSGKALDNAREGAWNYVLWVEQDGKTLEMSIDPSIIIKKIEDPLTDPPDETPTVIRDE